MMGLFDFIKGGADDFIKRNIEAVSSEQKSYDYAAFELQNDLAYDISALFSPASTKPNWTKASNFADRANKFYFQCSVSRACIEKRAQGIANIDLLVTGKASTKKLLQSPNPTDKTLSNALRVWETSLSIGGDLYLFYDLRNPFEPYIWALRQDLVSNNVKKQQYEYRPARLSGKDTPPQLIFQYDSLGNTIRCLELNGTSYKGVDGYPFEVVAGQVRIKEAVIERATIKGAQIDDLSVNTLKIAGGAITANQVATAADAYVLANGSADFITTGFMTIGDGVFGSGTIDVSFTIDATLQYDASCQVLLYTDIGSGWVLNKQITLGISTDNGNTYSRYFGQVSTVVDGPQVRVLARCVSGAFTPRSVARNFYVRDIVMTLNGAKR